MGTENVELPGVKTPSNGKAEKEKVNAKLSDVEMTMAVSPVCVKDGKQYAFVSFTEGDKMAEGKIPDCVIVSNKGFSAEETEQLEIYMKRELTNLKKMASSVNVLGAFMK